MDDQLRRFPAVLSALGAKFLGSPPPGLDPDGLTMLREALSRAFTEVNLYRLYMRLILVSI